MAGGKHRPCLELVFICCLSLLRVVSSREHGEKRLLLEGDVILGGLFPLHEPGPDGTCGHVSVPGVQALEAMLFAIDQVNRDGKILPGISLGAHILDTCKDPLRSVQGAMTFVHRDRGPDDAFCADGSRPHHGRKHKQPVCVIGPTSRTEAVKVVAELLGLFKVPQISFSPDTSGLLPEFEYFFQSAPSETNQAAVLADIVQELGWNYVSLVVSEGRYYEQNADAFLEEAKKSGRGICMATYQKIPRDAGAADMDRVIEGLLQHARAVGVVVFSTDRQASSLFSAAERMGAVNHFVWLGGETWHRDDVLTSSCGESVITLAHDRESEQLEEFAKYFSKLRPHNNKRNPWFGEYWEHHVQCVSESLSQGGVGEPCTCTGEEDITVSQHKWVRGVQDAVSVVTSALHDMHEEVCPRGRHGHRLCPQMENLDTELLMNFIANVTFGVAHGEEVTFDSTRITPLSLPERYNIFSVHTKGGNTRFRPAGQWNGFSSNPLDLNPQHIHWPGHARENETNTSSPGDEEGTVFSEEGIPKSVCSDPCSLGERKVTQRGDSCCWVCVRCAQGEYLKDDVTCEACPEGHLANHDFSACEPTNENEDAGDIDD
ncbi:metabotropic glutamate receptor 4-like [Branchiostoma floridae]|uniref:Metabotropic glutamate receptor 4-like n=1 Tax=Branchiostoma floridae TaxID=7739 RepID=A0A9J7LMA3_BRAFL|nr:metabotropic glutamate receptor 4-like [Branchiostoma floridae]